MRHAMIAAAAAAVLSLTACGSNEGDEGPNMRPGQDCLGCHSGFAAAGTVRRAAGVSGLAVSINVGGSARTTTTNSVGNFYVSGSGAVTAATINGVSMPGGNGITGHCNGCHAGGVPLP